jgi:hypothetical protein
MTRKDFYKVMNKWEEENIKEERTMKNKEEKKFLEEFIRKIKSEAAYKEGIYDDNSIVYFLQLLEDYYAECYFYKKLREIKRQRPAKAKTLKEQRFKKPVRRLIGYITELDTKAWNTTQDGAALRNKWLWFKEERA